MLIVGNNKKRIESLKNNLESEFEMKYIGDAKRTLGIDILRIREEPCLCLNKGILKRCCRDIA